MIYQHIINHLKLHQKDPVMVAVLCQKINEQRATPNEKKDHTISVSNHLSPTT
ncbi:hypothetical protein LHK59_13465 [Staphylococcus argenteus]|nr:hypothetical protein [Staphylococcus argenteus]